MSYLTVPFNADWIAAENTDVKAVYRRAHRHAITNEIERDAFGTIQWDYSILPVRRHNDWTGNNKGFEYVTLADAESLGMAAPWLRSQGLDPRSFIADPKTNSPWHPAKYAAVEQQGAQDEYARLREMVEKYGVEATEEIRGIAVPEALRAAAAKSAVRVKAKAEATA